MGVAGGSSRLLILIFLAGAGVIDSIVKIRSVCSIRSEHACKKWCIRRIYINIVSANRVNI